MKTKLFTLFVALLATTNLWAKFQYGNLYYETLSSNTAEVVGYISDPTSVSIPTLIQYNGKQYTVTSIGYRAFADCSSLTSVTIGNSVTSIGEYAFYYCSSLTSITIPNSVTSIGDDAFYGCSSLTKTNYTGDIASWCDIKFGSGDANPIYHSHNFYINDQEIKDLVIPNTVNSIHDYAFNGCSSLTSITIPNSVTSIGDWAFRDCSSLTSVTIGNSVTSIGYSAFYGCSSLTSVTIGNSVTSIGREAFYGCTALTIVICKAILVPSTGEDVFAHVPISSAVLYVPDESVDIYKYMDPWDGFGSILPISQLPTDVEDIQISSNKDASVKKAIRNGQVVILHNDKSYNIMGQEAE